MDAKTLLQGYYKATGVSPTTTTSSSANSFVQGYQQAISKPTITSTPTPAVQKAQVTLSQPKPTLLQNVSNTFSNIVKGITLSLKAPTVSKALPSSVFKQVPAINPSQPVKITPTQKKLTTSQLSTILPETTKAVTELKFDPLNLKANPKKAISDAWESIKQPIMELFKRTIEDYQPSKSISETIGKKVKRVTGAVNVVLSPISALFSAANNIPVIGSFTKLLSIPYIALGEAAPKVSNNLIDKLPISIQDKNNLKPAVAEVFTLASQLALAHFMDIGTKKARATISKVGIDVFEKLTKDMIETSGKSKVVIFDSKDLRALDNKYTSDLLKSLNVPDEQIKNIRKAALTGNSVRVEVQSPSIVRIIDKPYWEKVKNIFRLPETDKKVVGKGVVTKVSPIAGLLTDGEHTPQEVIGTVIKNNLEKTTEGKALIKAASEAQRTGQNIVVSKTEGFNPNEATPQQQIDLVKNAKMGKGEYKVGEIYTQKVMGQPRPILISKVNPDGSVEGFYAGAISQTERNFGIGANSLQPAKWNNPTKELQLPSQPPVQGGVKEGGMNKPTEKIPEAIKSQDLYVQYDDGTLEKIPDNLKEKFWILDNKGGPKKDWHISSHISQEGLANGTVKIAGTATEETYNNLSKRIVPEGKVEVKPKVVSVPREQLPIGEGEKKVSRLEARMKGVIGKATEQQIKDLGLSTYNTMNKAEQITKASQYVVNNQEEALDVLRGKVEPPKGIVPESIYIALTELAKDDITLATKLSSLSATALGQRISILSEINKDNPVRLLNEVYKVRAKAVEKRFGKNATEKVVKSIKEKVKVPDKWDWNNFINSIDTC